MGLGMIVPKAFIIRDVDRNSCTTWQWLYWIKLLGSASQPGLVLSLLDLFYQNGSRTLKGSQVSADRV